MKLAASSANIFHGNFVQICLKKAFFGLLSHASPLSRKMHIALFLWFT